MADTWPKETAFVSLFEIAGVVDDPLVPSTSIQHRVLHHALQSLSLKDEVDLVVSDDGLFAVLVKPYTIQLLFLRHHEDMTTMSDTRLRYHFALAHVVAVTFLPPLVHPTVVAAAASSAQLPRLLVCSSDYPAVLFLLDPNIATGRRLEQILFPLSSTPGPIVQFAVCKVAPFVVVLFGRDVLGVYDCTNASPECVWTYELSDSDAEICSVQYSDVSPTTIACCIRHVSLNTFSFARFDNITLPSETSETYSLSFAVNVPLFSPQTLLQNTLTSSTIAVAGGIFYGWDDDTGQIYNFALRSEQSVPIIIGVAGSQFPAPTSIRFERVVAQRFLLGYITQPNDRKNLLVCDLGEESPSSTLAKQCYACPNLPLRVCHPFVVSTPLAGAQAQHHETLLVYRCGTNDTNIHVRRLTDCLETVRLDRRCVPIFCFDETRIERKEHHRHRIHSFTDSIASLLHAVPQAFVILSAHFLHNIFSSPPLHITTPIDWDRYLIYRMFDDVAGAYLVAERQMMQRLFGDLPGKDFVFPDRQRAPIAPDALRKQLNIPSIYKTISRQLLSEVARGLIEVSQYLDRALYADCSIYWGGHGMSPVGHFEESFHHKSIVLGGLELDDLNDLLEFLDQLGNIRVFFLESCSSGGENLEMVAKHLVLRYPLMLDLGTDAIVLANNAPDDDERWRKFAHALCSTNLDRIADFLLPLGYSSRRHQERLYVRKAGTSTLQLHRHDTTYDAIQLTEQSVQLYRLRQGEETTELPPLVYPPESIVNCSAAFVDTPLHFSFVHPTERSNKIISTFPGKSYHIFRFIMILSYDTPPELSGHGQLVFLLASLLYSLFYVPYTVGKTFLVQKLYLVPLGIVMQDLILRPFFVGDDNLLHVSCGNYLQVSKSIPDEQLELFDSMFRQRSWTVRVDNLNMHVPRLDPVELNSTSDPAYMCAKITTRAATQRALWFVRYYRDQLLHERLTEHGHNHGDAILAVLHDVSLWTALSVFVTCPTPAAQETFLASVGRHSILSPFRFWLVNTLVSN